MYQIQQLAGYLSTRITAWPRDTTPRYYPRHDIMSFGPRPTAAELAEELFRDAEFRALGLGDWLGTDRGQLIAEAIEMVSPPFLRSDERLLQEALALAVAKQPAGKRWAGGLAVGAIAAFISLICLTTPE